ncbi:MAG: CHAT domain-containing protein [Chloroflexota bacterium]
MLSLLSILLTLAITSVSAQDATQNDDFDRGVQLYEVGDYNAALDAFELALDAYNTTNDRIGQADTLYQMGLIYFAQELYVDARNQFNFALTRYQEQTVTDGIARSLRYIARSNTELGNYEDALGLYGSALREARTINDLQLQAEILIDRATTYMAASRDRRDDTNLANQPSSYVNAQVDEAENEINNAIDDYTSASELYLTLPDANQYAETIVQRATAHRMVYDIGSADLDLQNASDQFASLGNQQRQAEILFQLADIRTYDNNLDGAGQILTEAITLFEQLNNAIYLNRALGLQGYLAYRQNFADAQQIMNNALLEQRALGDNEGRKSTLRYLGEYYLATRDYNLARNTFDELRDVATSEDDLLAEAWAFFGSGLAKAQGNIGELRDALNEIDYGMVRFRDYLRDYRTLRYINNLQAQFYLSRGEYLNSVGGEGAIQLLEDSLVRARSDNDLQGQAEANMQLAEAYVIVARDPNAPNAPTLPAWGDYSIATIYFRDAASLYERNQDYRQQGYALLRIGELQALSGRVEQANNTYDTALVAFVTDDYVIGQAQTYVRQAQIARINGTERIAYQLLTDAETLLTDIIDETVAQPLAELTLAEVRVGFGKLFNNVGKYDEAQQLFNQAEQTQALYNSSQRYLTLAYIGELELARDNPDIARNRFNQVLAFELNSQASAIAARGQAIIAANEGNLNAAQESFEDALSYSREVHDQLGEFDTFMAQGYIAIELGDFESARAFFGSAETSARGVNNIHEIALAQYGLSQSYIVDVEEPNRLGIAEREAQDALFSANQTGDTRLRIEISLTVGDMFLNNSAYDDALGYYNDALTLALEENYGLLEATTNLRIASIYQQRRQFTLGLNTLNNTQERIACLLDNVAPACSTNIQDTIATALLSDDNLQITLGVSQRQFGEIYIDLEQYSLADEVLSDATSILSLYASDYPQASIEFSYTQSAQGLLALITGDYASATGLYTEASRIAGQNGDLLGTALANYGLGLTYTRDLDPSNDDSGITLLDSAIVDFRSGALNARLLQASFVAKAEYYEEQGDVETSTEMYYQAIAEATNSNDRIGEATIQLQLGDLFRDTFQFDSAELIYSDAERIFERTQAPIGQGEALYRLGQLNILRVDYPAALANFNEMQLIYNGINDEVGLAQSYNAIGQVFYLQARYAQSLQSHLSALDVLQTPIATLETANSSATTTLEQELFSVLVINTQLETYQAIATVRLALADFIGSQEALDRAINLAVQTENQIIQTDLTMLSGQLLYAQALNNGIGYEAARQAFNLAIADYQERDDGLALGNANIFLGRVLIDLASRNIETFNNLEAAEDAYTIVQREAREFGDVRMEIEAWLGFGRVYNLQNDNQRAEANLLDARRLAQLVNSEELLISIYIELGLFYEEQQNFSQAEENYLNAIDLIEDVHSVMRIQTGQANFFAQNNLPYQRLVAYYIETGQDELAFNFAERGRSRTFIYHANREQLSFGENADSQTLEEWRETNALLADLYSQQNQLRSQEQSDDPSINQASVTQELGNVQSSINSVLNDVDRLQSSIEAQETVLSQVVYVNTPSVEDIRMQLEPDTTLITYYIIRGDVGEVDEVYAFVITQDDFRAVQLPSITQDEIYNVIDSINNQNNLENRAIGNLASDLITALVEHPDSFVQSAMNNTNWIIAPNDTLNVLPFTALIETAVPDQEVYLQYSPSASFYVALRERLGDVAPITETSSALVFGNPTQNSQSNLTNLQFAEQEAVAVAELYNATGRTRDDADEITLVQEASQHDVIHIAAHGVIERDNPLSTYLLLAEDSQTLTDGRLEVREIYTLQLQTRSPLVILSACDTNIDNLVDGDEFQGLARAFLVSGARGVLASLWQVDDQATSFLMESFHQYVIAGDHPSVALTKAQDDVRNNPDNNWSTPDYWAGFVYIGI